MRYQTILASRPVALLQYIIVFLPALVYFSIINTYALNIPSQDDYDAILSFLCSYKQAHGIDNFFLLFAQHGEHRILSSRICYVLYYVITGNINFKAIIFIGNLQLLAAFVLLVAFIRRGLPKFWFPAALVTSVCMFDLNNWENADFAMAGMQNFGVVFLFLLSLFLYSRNGSEWIVPAVIVQVLVTFSSGNGIVASAFIVLFNLLNKERPKIYASIVAFAGFAPLYFVHYIKVPVGGIHSIPTIIAYFFRFISNHIYYDNRPLSAAVGTLIFTCFVGLLAKAPKLLLTKTASPFICVTGFILCTILLTSVFRSGMGDYIPSRYLIYPDLLAALLFVFFLLAFQDKRIAMPLAILFTLLMLIAYNMNSRGGRRDLVKLHNTLKNSDYYYPRKETARNISEQSCQLTIYCIEKQRSEIK